MNFESFSNFLNDLLNFYKVIFILSGFSSNMYKAYIYQKNLLINQYGYF